MADPIQQIDPETGLTVTVKDGEVWFRSSGGYFSAPTAAEGLRYDPTAKLATPEEVSHRVAVKAQDSLVGAAATRAKAAGTHAIDAATMILRVPMQAAAAAIGDQKGLAELQNLNGQQVIENLAYITAELAGKEGGATAARYREQTAAANEANPTSAFLGGLAGDVLGGFGVQGAAEGLAARGTAALAGGRLGAVGARTVTGAANFGAQGALFGGSAAQEEAYFSNEPLTRQKLWAGIGMGAALGFGMGGVISGAPGGLAKIFGRKPAAVEGESAAAKAMNKAAADPDAMNKVAARALEGEGVKPVEGLGEKLHELIVGAQTALTEGEKTALGKYGPSAILDSSKRAEAMNGWQIARNRDAILDVSRKEMVEHLSTLERHASGGAFEAVRDLGMKEEAWRKLVDPAKRGKQVDTARAWARRFSDELDAMLPQKPAKAAGKPVEVAPADPVPPGIGFDAAATKANDVAEKAGVLDEVQTFLNTNRRAVSEAERRGEANATSAGVTKFIAEAQEKGATYEGLVYRGTNDTELAQIREAGEVTHTLSVSKDIEGAAHFAKKGGVLLEIKNHPVPVDGIEGSNTFAEALVGKGSPARIVGERVENGVRIVSIEMGALREAEQAAQPLGKVSGLLSDAANGNVVEAAFGAPERITQVTGHLRRAMSRIESGDVDGAAAALALDQFKRALGAQTKGTLKKATDLLRRGELEGDAVRETARVFEGKYEELRQLLQDEAIWGKAGTAQREINEGWVDWINSRQMFRGQIMTRTGTEAPMGSAFDFVPRFEVDADKVGSWLDKFATGRGELADSYIRKHIEATDKLTQAIGRYVDTGEVKASVEAVKNSTAGLKAQLASAEKTIGIANQVNLVLNAKSGIGAQLGLAATGAIAGGPVGAAIGTVLGALTNPGRMLRTAMAAEALLSKTDAAKQKVMGDFFSRATAAPTTGTTQAAQAVGRRVPVLAKRGAGALAGKGGEFFAAATERPLAYEKRREQLAQLTTNPALLQLQIQRTIGPLGDVAPKLGAALSFDIARKLNLLQQMAPPAPPQSVGATAPARLRKAAAPDAAAIQRFADQWDGVMNPYSVLSDLSKGKLSRAKVEAVRVAHPELMQELALDLFTELSRQKKPLLPQAALQLDLLLGTNGALEPSVRPDFLARMQSLAQIQAQQEQQGAPQPRPPTNMAAGTKTLSQTIGV